MQDVFLRRTGIAGMMMLVAALTATATGADESSDRVVEIGGAMQQAFWTADLSRMVGLIQGRNNPDLEPPVVGHTLASGDHGLGRGGGRVVIARAPGQTAMRETPGSARPVADILEIEQRLSAEAEALLREIQDVDASVRGLQRLERHAQHLERDGASTLGGEELRVVVAAIAAQRAAIATAALGSLAEADGSLRLLSFYLALGEGDAAEANRHARQLVGPARGSALTVAAAVDAMSETEVATTVDPVVSARIPTLRREVRVALVQEIEGVDASAYQRAVGLIDRLEQRAEREYAASLGTEEMERAAAAIAAQRVAVGETVRDEIIGQVQAVPFSFSGAQTLDRIEQQTVAQRAELIGREGLEAVVTAIRERRLEIVTAALETLAAVDGSLPLLSYYLALDAGALADANQHANRLPRPAQDDARTVAAALGTAAQTDLAQVVDLAASVRIPTLRRELRKELVEEIQAIEGSAEGFTLLVRHARRAQRDYAPRLGVEEMQRIEAAIVARRAAMGETIRDEIVLEVRPIPVSIAAFRSLDAVAPEHLLALLHAAEARTVRETVAERRQAIAAELLPSFAALPETDDALLEIEEVILPELERLPASASAERESIERAAKARHAEILAAVTRAEAGPLQGRVYQGPLWTIEFIDESRVVATKDARAPTVGTYEELADGRVIITVNNEAMVFSREGARLISGPIRLHRLRAEPAPKSPLLESHPGLEWPSLSGEVWQHATPRSSRRTLTLVRI